jgi:hypothetical protein
MYWHIAPHFAAVNNHQKNRRQAMPEDIDKSVNSPPEVVEPERIPAMQRLLDNPFLLLFLGVVIPTVFYIIWGVMEIVNIPLAR